MVDKIEKGVETLADLISDKTKPDEALKFTQAIMNLTYALAKINETESRQEPDK